MKKICNYKTFFSKKDKVKLEGESKSYDTVSSRNDEYVVFEKHIREHEFEYALYSLETGKLLLVSENISIAVFERLNNFIYIQSNSDNKNRYLFKINSNNPYKNCNYTFIPVLKNSENLNLTQDITDNFSFILKYNLFFYACNLFFTDKNEIFNINENCELEEIECPLKGNKDYTINYYNIIKNNTYLVSFVYSKDNSYKSYYNIYYVKDKKFLLKNFIDVQIIDYEIYNDKIYIINEKREIFDGDGNVIFSDPCYVVNISFHPTMPYAISERANRKGLISLEEKKIIFKPICLEILVYQDEILYLENEGGAYKHICLKDK